MIRKTNLLLAISLALLLPPRPAHAQATKWEYKVVSLAPLIQAWRSEPPEKTPEPKPPPTPTPAAEHEDLYSIAADLQKILYDAYAPRLEAYLNEQGRAGWELCSLGEGAAIFKRPAK